MNLTQMIDKYQLNKIVLTCKEIGRTVILVLYAVYSYLYLIFRMVVPPQSKSLDGEIFLITGSSSGIGREVALHLARFHPKTKLVLWATNAERNKKTAEDAKQFGATVYNYELDVSNREQVEETAKKVKQEVGDVTILFNNAGIVRAGSFLELSAEDIEKTIQVNLMSHFYTLRSFLPDMIKNNHGHVVTHGSLGSYFAYKNCLPYFATKFAIRGYIEALQYDLRAHKSKPDNIKFTTIFPGIVDTPMTANYKDELSANEFLDASYVARKIIDGIRQNQQKVIIPRGAELAILAKSLMPDDLFLRLGQHFVKEKSDK